MKQTPKLGRVGWVPLDLPPSWHQLTYFQRSLALGLIAHADRETLTVVTAGDWRDSLMHTLAMPGRDRRQAAPALDRLATLGILTVGTGKITVNIAPVAELSTEQPLYTQRPHNVHTTSIQRPHNEPQPPEIIQVPLSNSDSGVLLNSAEQNLKPRAREFLKISTVNKSYPRARDDADASPYSDPLENRASLEFKKRARDAGIFPRETHLFALVDELVPWLKEVSKLQNTTPEELLISVLDQFFADGFAKGTGFEPKLLQTTLNRYVKATAPKQKRLVHAVDPKTGEVVEILQ